MKAQQQQIKAAAAQVGQGIKEKHGKEAASAVQQSGRQGTLAKDALGLTDAMVEGIYGQAYQLYNTGKYQDASKLFRLLIMINSTEPKYSMGLAACFHMLKEYKNAVDIYAVIGVIDANNPISFYHASDCYMQMNDSISALISLEMAVKRAGNKPEFKALKDRALLTISSLKKEVAKIGK